MVLAEGVWAEVIVNGEHLRLFSEHNAQGVQTSVQAKIRDIAGQAIRVADQAKNQVQRVQDAVDAGVRTFKEAKNSTSHRPS
jgi:hypothetical protein